eukprot:scaffold54458_cov36-Cyclotella_meneghiniana.AAC.3
MENWPTYSAAAAPPLQQFSLPKKKNAPPLTMPINPISQNAPIHNTAIATSPPISTRPIRHSAILTMDGDNDMG